MAAPAQGADGDQPHPLLLHIRQCITAQDRDGVLKALAAADATSVQIDPNVRAMLMKWLANSMALATPPSKAPAASPPAGVTAKSGSSLPNTLPPASAPGTLPSVPQLKGPLPSGAPGLRLAAGAKSMGLLPPASSAVARTGSPVQLPGDQRPPDDDPAPKEPPTAPAEGPHPVLLKIRKGIAGHDRGLVEAALAEADAESVAIKPEVRSMVLQWLAGQPPQPAASAATDTGAAAPQLPVAREAATVAPAPAAVPQLPASSPPMAQKPVAQLPVPQLPAPQLPAAQLPVPQLPAAQLPVPQLPVPQLPVARASAAVAPAPPELNVTAKVPKEEHAQMFPPPAQMSPPPAKMSPPTAKPWDGSSGVIASKPVRNKPASVAPDDMDKMFAELNDFAGALFEEPEAPKVEEIKAAPSQSREEVKSTPEKEPEPAGPPPKKAKTEKILEAPPAPRDESPSPPPPPKREKPPPPSDDVPKRPAGRGRGRPLPASSEEKKPAGRGRGSAAASAAAAPSIPSSASAREPQEEKAQKEKPQFAEWEGHEESKKPEGPSREAWEYLKKDTWGTGNFFDFNAF